MFEEANNMGEQKKNSIYNAADIKKYLSGEMNATEMYAIEKAALDDPFLSEAMEGYEAMEQKDWSKELAALKQKLVAEQSTPVVPINKTSFTKWWKAAAAVLVIGSSIAITYLFTTKKINNNPASGVTVADNAPVAKLDSAAAINRYDTSSIATDIAKNEGKKIMGTTAAKTNSKTLLAEEKTKQEAQDKLVYKPAYRDTKDMAAGGNTTDNREKNNAGAATINPSSSAATQQSPEVNADKAMPQQENKLPGNYKSLNKAKAAINNFNAQVVTADDKPVAFANVNIQQNNKTVYTDENGNFKLTAADSALNVVVTSAGFKAKKITLQNAAVQNKIVLEEDNPSLSEVVTTRRKTAAKKELKKTIEDAGTDDEDATPSGGWVEYNNYLNSNLIFPGEAKQKNIHGVVEVFVKLKNNGDISQLKVDKPLCTECDAEAIRLVKEGPKWEVKKNKAAKVKVKIKF